MMALIKVEKLCKSYGRKTVLKDLSFSVSEGDYLYVVGENGSGKTTLMKLILGLIEPDSGNITLGGFSRTEIGYLPQSAETQLDFPASAYEVVLTGTQTNEKFFPFYTRKDKKTALDAMKRFEIQDLKKTSFRSLSGGQKQRVLLARALCATKKVILLDEPITALDPVATAEFYEIINELRKSKITVIIISHDISCAVHYGNKILHLCGDETFFGDTHDYVHSPLGERMLKGGHCHG